GVTVVRKAHQPLVIAVRSVRTGHTLGVTTDRAVVGAPRDAMRRGGSAGTPVAHLIAELVLVELVRPIPADGHLPDLSVIADLVGRRLAPILVEPVAARILLQIGLRLHETHLGVGLVDPLKVVGNQVLDGVVPGAVERERRRSYRDSDELVAVAPSHARDL